MSQLEADATEQPENPGAEPKTPDSARIRNIVDPKTTINKTEVEAKFSKDPERAKEFLAFASKLLSHLPQDEQLEFAANPIRFCSKTLAFRGLTSEKYENLKKQEYLTPQSGSLGAGTGVFLSNSPYQAFTYQAKGTIVVIDRNNFVYATQHKIVVPGTPRYEELCDSYLASLPENERKEAVWYVDDNWDMETPSVNGDTIISLRKPQPLSATKVCLTWHNDDVVEEFNLTNAEMTQTRAEVDTTILLS